MKIEEALAGWLLEDYRKAAISAAKLNAKILEFYISKQYKGTTIERIRKSIPGVKELDRIINNLCSMQIIKNSKNTRFFYYREYYLITAFSEQTVESIVCSIYEYGYISYLSSMRYYGITDRIPKKVHFTSCDQLQWKIKSIEDLEEKIPKIKNKDYEEIKYFIPNFPKNIEIDGYDLIHHTITKYIQPKISNTGVRVQDIGLLFLDILREPDYSGGVDHVISVFKEFAPKYYRRIISQTNSYGKAIDKARVGFLFEKVLSINSDMISEWKKEKSNQRGGSRKLISSRAFSPKICAEWNISVNVEELHKYAD